MCLHIRKCTLNIFNGAKYFNKTISISISLSLQLSVKYRVTKVRMHSDHVEATRVKNLEVLIFAE